MGPTGSGRPRLSKWIAAVGLAQAGNRNAVICCLGDSTTAGAGANGASGSMTNARVNAYPAQLATLLGAVNKASIQSISGTNQAGSTWTNHQAYNPSITTATAADWRASTSVGSDFGFASIVGTAAGTAKLSWAPSGAVDTFEVWYVEILTGGTLSVFFDGSGTATEVINTSNAVTGLKKKTYTLAPGTHTIELQRTAGSNINIAQVVAYNSSEKEITIMNGGGVGQRVSTLALATNPFDSLNALKALQPDLTIINAALNDMADATSQASYEAALTAMVNAAKVSGDVLLVFPNDRSGVTDTLRSDFYQYNVNVARAARIPLIDLRSRLGMLSAANAAGYMSGDSIHPSGTGYGVIAQYIYETIAAGLV